MAIINFYIGIHNIDKLKVMINMIVVEGDRLQTPTLSSLDFDMTA